MVLLFRYRYSFHIVKKFPPFLSGIIQVGLEMEPAEMGARSWYRIPVFLAFKERGNANFVQKRRNATKKEC